MYAQTGNFLGVNYILCWHLCSMASRYCQKPFEFVSLVKPPFNIGELQIFNGEIGKGMGEFSKAMVESCLGSFSSR